MYSLLAVIALFLLAGCVTPHKEVSGKYIKPAQTEIRSSFGTNQSFARLERCDGPEKEPWLFYREKDFKSCVLLTKAEQDEWMHGYSRGAGPEIVGAAIIGASTGGAIAAAGGATATASAGASATNTAIQTVGKHGRR